MRPLAFLANSLWLASGRRASRRFLWALGAPEEAQDEVLRRQLALGAGSQFGEKHHFGALRSYADFARQVPLAAYEDLLPEIEKIRRGEQGVLSNEKVSRLVPTSGSTGARKLIPFTPSLSRAFDAAVAPWMRDLARQRPDCVRGKAYWSVSPLAGAEEGEPTAVPIGFADDSEYLGGALSWLIGKALAVPSSARFVREEEAFWPLVLVELLREAELRLISIWHPSFLELLAGAAERFWKELLEAVASGENPWLEALPAGLRESWQAGGRKRPRPQRAAELRRIGKESWQLFWPRLAVVSCWGDQAARGGWQRLVARLTGVLVQAKGLLASEGVVTLPFAGQYPLAITSHFFEFLAENGEIRRAHQLERGRTYEVILSNGGGLWRYRLGDLVECSGHLGKTPTLRFLGRVGNVSDLRGEKLAEPFVAEALRGLFPEGRTPLFATLRAFEEGQEAGYELLLSGEPGLPSSDALLGRLEEALRANPHYELARRLGQLLPPRIALAGPGQEQQALLREGSAGGARIGEIKPKVLVGLPPR